MFHIPMSSPMITRMLGRGAGVCAMAGVVAHKPIATVDANSFPRNDCRLSSPVALIVCPFAEKGRSELLPGQAHHRAKVSAALCRFGRNRAAAEQGRERRLAEQPAIGDGEAASLREAVQTGNFGDARRLVI